MIKITAYRLVGDLIEVDIVFDYDGTEYNRTASTNKNNVIGKTEEDVKNFVTGKVDGYRNELIITQVATLLDPMLNVDLEAL